MHKVFKAMMNDAISNKPLGENSTAVLQAALEKHSMNSFSQQLFGDLIKPKGQVEPSTEEILLNRLNMIKVKCGVEELANLPNMWSKKKSD